MAFLRLSEQLFCIAWSPNRDFYVFQFIFFIHRGVEVQEQLHNPLCFLDSLCQHFYEHFFSLKPGPLLAWSLIMMSAAELIPSTYKLYHKFSLHVAQRHAHTSSNLHSLPATLFANTNPSRFLIQRA